MIQKAAFISRVGNLGKYFNAFKALRGILPVVFCICSLCTLLTSCEATGGGKGVVVDSLTTKPVAGATVVLFFNNKPVDTVITDSFGSFTALREYKSVLYRPDCSLLVLKENYRDEKVPVTFLWHNDAYFDKDDIRVFLRPMPAPGEVAQ